MRLAPEPGMPTSGHDVVRAPRRHIANRPGPAAASAQEPQPPWRRVAVFQALSVSAWARLDGYGGRFQT